MALLHENIYNGAAAPLAKGRTCCECIDRNEKHACQLSGAVRGLGAEHRPVAIHIGHGIYWYGIILAAAMLAGLYLCMKQSKHYGLTEDNVMDMVLWAVPCCIIGSRIYYVLFYLDLYRKADGSLDWGAMLRIWDGGLAIYGTVIVGVLVALIYTKRHKIPFFAMTDLAGDGFDAGADHRPLGQFHQPGGLRHGNNPALADEAVGHQLYQH